MQLISTRGGDKASFETALMQGLARDGGLFIPEQFPDLSWIMRGDPYIPYVQVARWVMRAFWPESGPQMIYDIIEQTYTRAIFGSDAITPLVWLDDDTAILRLSGGPTRSFKDVALQLVIRLMSYVLAQQGRTLTLILATSGDTGSAAAEAVRGIPNIRLFVLIPKGRISEFQRRQMTTIPDQNVFIIEVDVPFDALQGMVKDVFADHGFCEKIGISGVNSINWGRIVAQSVYWISACLQAKQRYPGIERVIGRVPTGNFGDIYAGYVARRCGLPLDLVACTNENNILYEVFTTGFYRPRTLAEVIATSSPSMDIATASNFERLLAEAVRRNPTHVYTLMAKIARGQRIELPRAKLAAEGFTAAMTTQQQVLETIKRTHDTSGLLIDPHTAVALHSVTRQAGKVTVVAETALPVKFPDTIERATGIRPPMTAAEIAMMAAPERIYGLPHDVAAFKDFIATH